MELAWLLIGLAALMALAFGEVMLYRLATGWDNEAPGDPDTTHQEETS